MSKEEKGLSERFEEFLDFFGYRLITKQASPCTLMLAGFCAGFADGYQAGYGEGTDDAQTSCALERQQEQEKESL